MDSKTTDLIHRLQNGDKRALARLLTFVENRHDDLLQIMAAVFSEIKGAIKIGITGPPGAGKSTLVNQLIKSYRDQGKTVGVLAIDPSSPFSGGAVLGDRIRMQDHNADEGVFIRSVGSRGAHGGLSRATRDMVNLFDVFGFDVILIETVGVGQTELDIMEIADTTLVVLVPESGDTVQTMKAGLLEIADIFIVNKADRDGADRIAADLAALVELSPREWVVPVLKTTATKGEGVGDVIQKIKDHHEKQKSGVAKKNADGFKRECLQIALSELELKLSAEFQKINEKAGNPYASAVTLLKKVKL